jgi:three-Cys-motif partner protein
MDNFADRAKREGFKLKTSTILIERKSSNFSALIDNLRSEGYGPRMKQTIDFHSLKAGEIAVVEDDVTKLGKKLTDFTTSDPFAWSFYFVDPYGPSGIPYNLIRSIVSGGNHDVIINFMTYDLIKKAGAAIKGSQADHVAHWTEAFGNTQWIELKKHFDLFRTTKDKRILDELFYLASVTSDDIEDDELFRKAFNNNISLDNKEMTFLHERLYVYLYRSVLRKADPQIAIKTIKLQDPIRDRGIFYLFLTTHEGTGALEMNRILNHAELREHDLRNAQQLAQKAARMQQGMLFDPEVVPAPALQQPKRPTKEECSKELMSRFRGRRVTKREILKEIADSVYFNSEIDSALKYLKGKQLVCFDRKDPKSNTMIDFDLTK